MHDVVVVVVVMLSAAAGLALALTALAPIGTHGGNATCGYNDCADFCDGACPYRANMSFDGAQNLTVYRLTPWNVTDLVNHNTGTAAGDVGFMLQLYMDGASSCHPPYVTSKCFLADRPLVGRFDVEFDAAYGPYLKCNPTNADNSTQWLNMTRWLCAYNYPGSGAWTCVLACVLGCVDVRARAAALSHRYGCWAAACRVIVACCRSLLSFVDDRPSLSPLFAAVAAAVVAAALLLLLLHRTDRTPCNAQTATALTCPSAPTQPSTRGTVIAA